MVNARMGVAVALAVVLLPAKLDVVHAQEAGAARVLEEVVVTSRKRSESLQDIPIAVTAVNEETIRELRIDNIENVATITPNLLVHTSAGGSPSAVACMRGMCRTNTIITEDPMVGTYVDGVYLGKAVGSLIDVLDLERVEVLRGPQGTLYGKNTLGGAINLVVRKPSGEFNANLKSTVGNEGQVQLRGGVDFPLGDKMAGRFSYLNMQRDPVVTNPIGPDYGDEDVQAGMLNLQWFASEKLSLNYLFDKTKVDQLSDVTTLTFANTPVYNSANPPQCISGCTLVGWDIIGVDLKKNVTPEFSDTYISDGTDHHQELDVTGHALIAELDIGDNTTLKSITSRRRVDVDYALSYGIKIFYAERTVETTSYSQEFQLQGLVPDAGLAYTLGLFYYSEDGEETNLQDIPGFFARAGYETEIESQSYALFGEATYDLNEQWDLTLGLRYTIEDKSADKIATDYSGASPVVFMNTYNGTYLGSTSLPSGAPVFYEREIDNDSLAPRLSVTYSPVDDWMFYGTYARGYKSGGFNAASTSPVSWQPFEDVVVDSIELGAKATLWDGRAQLNVTLFHSEADDMQVQINQLSPVGTFEAVLTNAGQADVNGAEIEASLRPTDRLDITLGIGYQDAEFKEYKQPDGAGGFIDVADQRVLEFTPEYTYNLGMRYILANTQRGIWTGRVDVHGMDEHDFQPVAVEEIAADAYHLVSARLSVEEIPLGSGLLGLALWGKNLTDESYRTGGFTFTEDIGFNSYGLPRIYGLDVEYTF